MSGVGQPALYSLADLLRPHLGLVAPAARRVLAGGRVVVRAAKVDDLVAELTQLYLYGLNPRGGRTT